MLDLFYPTHAPIKGARKVVLGEGKNPRAEYLAEYYRANRERIRAAQAEYYRANREQIIKRVGKNQAEAQDQHAARNRVYYRRIRQTRNGPMPGKGRASAIG